MPLPGEEQGSGHRPRRTRLLVRQCYVFPSFNCCNCRLSHRKKIMDILAALRSSFSKHRQSDLARSIFFFNPSIQSGGEKI